MRTRTKFRAISIVLLAVGMLAGSGDGYSEAKKNKRAARPKPVVVAVVKSVSEAPTFKANGLLAPAKKSLLSVEVSGRVTEVLQQEGDYVEKGQVLAVLSNANLGLEKLVLQARVREAEAERSQSRNKLKRIEALFKQNLASAEQYENELAAMEVTEARHASTLTQLNRIVTQLNMMVVRAPISGQVIKADLEIGQWINSTRPIYEIYNYDRFELLVGVPGRFFNKIDRDTPVTLRVTEIGKTLKGKIQAVVRHVDSASGNFMLRIQVENPKRTPLSGLLARIDVPVSRNGRVLTVPRDAIVRRKGGTQVVVVRKGRAQIVRVKIRGNINQTDVIVDGKLKAREQVVVRGNERLSSGTPVKITGKL
ncbi:MAG: efflux RND transporter periplasmic adaptor subunit [SAR324 cluster bacterium]|nr:efflux RND transporter periplasmic adaptor subunit [SAR324 cluster bacterium]MCZ6533351.1 efflux RND transporter periplasmic adaptor subunit [SAR324 cluster bacterium]